MMQKTDSAIASIFWALGELVDVVVYAAARCFKWYAVVAVLAAVIRCLAN